MFLLIPVPKPTAYLLHETPLFCRPLQNISFLSHSSSYVLATPPILAIFTSVNPLRFLRYHRSTEIIKFLSYQVFHQLDTSYYESNQSNMQP